MDSREFLGRGLGFPFRVDPSTGKIAMASHEEDIRQSIQLILGTYMGERVMRPEFGAKVNDYLFEQNTLVTGYALRSEILEALVRWEPRIDQVDVQVVPDNSGARIDVHISYLVRSTNNMFNVVYPFYLLEGEGLEGS